MVAVVSVLVGMLTLVASLGMAAFQTLRADIREIKTDIREVKAEVQDVDDRLSAEIKASEARQRQDLREAKAELKAELKAVTERLDRMFERLPVPQAGQ